MRLSIFGGVAPWLQRLILHISTKWHRLRIHGKSIDWVVGPFEIAGLVQSIAGVVPSSESVLMERHKFYEFLYDWVAPRARTALGRIAQGPWKLGELVSRASGFIYVGETGFLTSISDGRAFEFAFLRAHGKRIVCYFTGNDIRSPLLSAERELSTGEPNLATYLAETSSVFATEGYEAQKRALAASADAFADLVFNADVGQRGHLTRPSEHFLYFHPDSEIASDFSKFRDVTVPLVVHAPSSPIVKGTQLVRAAIATLREEGYAFQYRELVRQSHAEVRENLERAHIVLNQFYSEVPGVLGVEALAAGCVVLMRADEHDEPILPPGSNDAWVVTRHHEVTGHLRQVLEHPEKWEQKARAGTRWVQQHAAASVTGRTLRAKLSQVLTSDRSNTGGQARA